ncbi:MAG: RecX family transcriptional regulator, partial [Flavobacterium sp.]|nr:RecX family transcriptional regulator [Flavobacterium sp.]MBP6100633.1 RecX family transcriptional regulator [Flavobacterium sp.]
LKSTADLSLKEVIQKMEYYCAYQERCHAEIKEKLYSFQVTPDEKDQIIVHLLDHNYLNEERFASVYTQSKLHQKKWGKKRITLELKAKQISSFLITKSIREIDANEYKSIFDQVSEKHWDTITEKNTLKKRKKFCDYLLRKGWESDWVYEKVKDLELS